MTNVEWIASRATEILGHPCRAYRVTDYAFALNTTHQKGFACVRIDVRRADLKLPPEVFSDRFLEPAMVVMRDQLNALEASPQ